MYYRLEVAPRLHSADPRADRVMNQVRDFLGLPVRQVRTRQVFSLELDCQASQAQQIVADFANPVIDTGNLGESFPECVFQYAVIVGYRPGVTDNVARSARTAIADILGRDLVAEEKVFTSCEYFFDAPQLQRADIEHIARDLLANELIETIAVIAADELRQNGFPRNLPVMPVAMPPHVEEVDLEIDDAALLQLSKQRTLALSLEEMRAIQAYYRGVAAIRRDAGLPANPTDVELEVLAQTWSEHCKHKIFNATIDYTDEQGVTRRIDSCFKEFIRKSTAEIGTRIDWLVSVFHDNAGVIRFNDRLDIVYKVETHNSPTALDPYGGSITGIVGVNRDPLGTGQGAELLLNAWGYCFASPFTAAEDVPPGLFHPRRLRDQVHKGVIDGGNQSGIPYAAGWEYFDQRYLGKPLVYCGTVGILPRQINGSGGHEKFIAAGDIVVMTGGRIGKDGIHGATFSSEELHQESPVQAVQIGDPITQKKMSDFIIEARNAGLYNFITDNGAGGLSSSLGEMAEHSGGCRIDLALAPLKYAGLQPWEILVSEAQERMSLAVPPAKLAAFLELARQRDVEATVLGEFTDDGWFHVLYDGTTVARLSLDFLHDGLPKMHLQAKWQVPCHAEPQVAADLDIGQSLCQMLRRLNIASGEYKARQYDHEVKGLSVIKPFVGTVNNVASDATVSLVEPLSREGIILATGFAPRYSDIDTYHMTASVVDMAIRRSIAVGGRMEHIAGLDNFCWPDPVAGPNNPDGQYKAAQLVRANQALYDYTTAFDVPLISGKDSMKNDSTMGGKKISIPPSLLFSTIARIADVSKAVTLGVKRYGDDLYVIGTTYDELGGSEFYAMLNAVGNNVPKVNAAAARHLYERVSAATDVELCHSLHTPGYGGLAVAFAKVAIGGHLGLHIDLDKIVCSGQLTLAALLFSESNSRFIATVASQHRQRFEAVLADVPFARVGQVLLDPELVFCQGNNVIARLPVDDLVAAYTSTLASL